MPTPKPPSRLLAVALGLVDNVGGMQMSIDE